MQRWNCKASFTQRVSYLDDLSQLIFSPLSYLSENELWVQKHVRPDETIFILHSSEVAAFGKGKNIEFSWSFGPIVVRIVLKHRHSNQSLKPCP